MEGRTVMCFDLSATAATSCALTLTAGLLTSELTPLWGTLRCTKHSIAGIHVQLYAGRYPDDVAGVVLVDSSHEDQLNRKEMTQIPSFYPPLIKALSPSGVVRLMDLEAV